MSYMKKLLCVIFALGIFSCQQNKKVTILDNQGNIIYQYYVLTKDIKTKNGPYEAFYEDGTLMEKATYKQGVLEGERNLYYPNGAVNVVENYKNGMFEGSYAEFFNHGGKKSEGQYINNEMSGLWKFYFNEPKNQIREEIHFQGNVENGPYTLYSKKGFRLESGTYKNGFEEGKIQIFDTLTGKLIRETVFKDSMVVETKRLQ